LIGLAFLFSPSNNEEIAMISSNFTASNLKPNHQEISYGADLELAKFTVDSNADLISNGRPVKK
jgi:hypothetical protein